MDGISPKPWPAAYLHHHHPLVAVVEALRRTRSVTQVASPSTPRKSVEKLGTSPIANRKRNGELDERLLETQNERLLGLVKVLECPGKSTNSFKTTLTMCWMRMLISRRRID